MNIAMVSEHANPLAAVGGVDAGGQNVHVASLSAQLAARGHEVVVYTRRDSPKLPHRAELCPGVTVVHLNAGPAVEIGKDDLLVHIPALAEQLARAVDADPPSVLHAHFWMSGLAGLQVVTSREIPMLQTFHALGTVKRRCQGGADTSPAERIDVERELAVRADRVIAACTDEVRELMTLGAVRSRIDIVPSGVDTAHFTPDGPVAQRSTRHRLLCVGRLVPRKGVDDAIRALAQLDEVELVVAGGPAAADIATDPEAMRLLQLAAALGVADRVHLIGQVPRAELPALIRSSDLVVCLPWYEPFGIVPLEAMACGVPVVGTAVGGLLDTVMDGVTGALLPPRNPVVAAQALRELLGSPERRRAFGRAGCQRVRRHYAWPDVARATERCYLRAISGRAGLAAAASAEVAG
jgi:D-inositol-3-phosphate glycosyltransferase